MTAHRKHLLMVSGLGLALIGALALWPVNRKDAGGPAATVATATAAALTPPPAAAALAAAAPAAPTAAPAAPTAAPLPLPAGSLQSLASLPPAPAAPANPAAPTRASPGGKLDAAGADLGKVQDRYAKCEVLDEQFGLVDVEGCYERVRVVKTAMKYPLVRVVEKRVQGSGFRVQGWEARRHEIVSHQVKDELAQDMLLSQTAMVADHVTLKVKEGTTEAELAAYARTNGGEILRKLRVPGPGTYLVKMAEAKVDTVPQAVAAWGQAGGPVEYVTPDFIAYASATIPNDPRFAELYGLNNTMAGVGTVRSGPDTLSAPGIHYSSFTPPAGLTGTLYACGLGKAGQFPPEVSGNIALIQRGDITFAEKATNAKAAGAKAAIIYNNVSGLMYATFASPGDWLSSVFVSDTDGALLLSRISTLATVIVSQSDCDIDAPEAWDISTGSSSVVVGVIDSGIDYTHPDLAANIWTNPGEIAGNGIDDDGNGFVDDVHGFNFANDTGDPMDDLFHGTHCAGTIGAVGNNGVGVAGVCWNVRMMALKFLDANGGGVLSDGLEAIYYATANGAKLTSNSWGWGDGFDQGFSDAITDAGNHGILFVAAAGNSANNNDGTHFYPSGFDCSNIVAVAATDYYDALASFSCYGPTTVDLGAPGVAILSTYPTYMTAAMTQRGDPTHYNAISGTSMATPHVAGAFALLAAAHPELTMAQARVQLLLQADPSPSLDGKCVTGGRLNAAKALTISSSPVLRLWGTSVTDPEPGGNGDGRVNPGETVQMAVTLINGGRNTALGVTATLTTADPMVTIVTNTAAFGDIPGFGEKQALNPFVFVVSNATPAHAVTFELITADTAGGAWTNSVRVPVRIMTQISGVVTVNGTPAKDYTVVCSGTATTISDNQGRYLFNVLDGTYTLYAVHPIITSLMSTPTQVTTPPDATNVNFALTTSRMSGRVTDAKTGNPLPDATVDYYCVSSGGKSWNSWVMRGNTAVDSDGRYEFTVLTGGTSTMSITPWMPGYSNSSRIVTIPPDALDVDFAMVAPDAAAGIAPTALEVSGVIGETVTQTLTIANSGAHDLLWRLWNESDEGNATAGQVLRQFTSPLPEGFGAVGAAFEGRALCVVGWRLAGFSTLGLFRIDPMTGALLDTWSDAEVRNIVHQPYDYGLDWDGVNLWFSDYMGKEVIAANPATRQTVKRLNVVQNQFGSPYGVVFGGGYLWVLTDDRQVLKADRRTGATLSSWTLPAAVATRALGIEYFSGAIWVAGYDNRMIYKLSPMDGRLIRSFPGPTQFAMDVAKSGSGPLWVVGLNAYMVSIGEAPWLNQNATAGTVAGGGSQTVQFTFNTVTAGLGVHTAMVSVASNDPNEPERLVPVTFTVTETRSPVVDVPAWANPNPVPLPATATLGVVAHDPDGDPLIYTWSKASGPGAVVFTPNGTAAGNSSVASFGAAGTYVLRVTVSNNRPNEIATSDVTVIVGGIETEVAALSVPEGGTALLRVRLSTQPAGNVTVTAARTSGDSDITVSGGSLAFTPSDWNFWHTVTVAAAEDTDADNGVATLGLSAPGLATAVVFATEADNDTTLRINAGPGGTVAPAGLNVVSKGVAVSIAASASTGHSFARWVVTEGVASFGDALAATTTVTVTAPATIRANFNPALGTLLAWGMNGSGQLGDGTTVDQPTPVPVIMPGGAPLADVAALAAGGSWTFGFTVARKNDGSVWSWGCNRNGQLGDGTTADRANPVPIAGISDVTSIAAGCGHTVALTSDGSVWTWGDNGKGQLGDGTTTNRLAPTAVPGLSVCVRISGP